MTIKTLFAGVAIASGAVVLAQQVGAQPAMTQHEGAQSASAATQHGGVHSGPAMNYRVVDDRLATGGHFVGDGLKALAADGLEVVIDLRPEPPDNQKQKVSAQGIEYVHVPVSWSRPQVEQFHAFRNALQQHRGKHVLVQCAANYRASAMTYLYQALVEQVPDAAAAAPMLSVWTPDRKWRKYLERVKNDFKPTTPTAL